MHLHTITNPYMSQKEAIRHMLYFLTCTHSVSSLYSVWMCNITSRHRFPLHIPKLKNLKLCNDNKCFNDGSVARYILFMRIAKIQYACPIIMVYCNNRRRLANNVN